MLELAVKKRLFARAAKKVVSVAEDLPDNQRRKAVQITLDGDAMRFVELSGK